MTNASSGTTDGAFDRLPQNSAQHPQVPAIFIHAGAGFHSHQNEKFHLEACIAAAEMGMKFLKVGASATEAVEASLRILEDKEITNAGYGSNLSINGRVECDATIVDHLGRSGACGAVPNVRNPISLAKLILDTSSQPLSLRRVPPNALVGDGARDFAEEHGMATFPNEKMVSRNARDRYLRWQEDLKRADVKRKETSAHVSPERTSSPTTTSPCTYAGAVSRTFPRDHTAAIASGTWNEGQPDSPNPSIVAQESPTNAENSPASSYFRNLGASPPTLGQSTVRVMAERASASNNDHGNGTLLDPSRNLGQGSGASRKRPRSRGFLHRSGISNTAKDEPQESSRDGSSSPASYPQISDSDPDPLGLEGDEFKPRTRRRKPLPLQGDADVVSGSDGPLDSLIDSNDKITDTIGAIAIDNLGNIAAGSSSGGIGMKHHGRLGPAALVGIGTAVVPCAEDDEDAVSVAAVTSGTGEHMATTMASQRCAERIYHGNRRGPANVDVQEDDEDAIIGSFVTDDFMNHPGVKNCHSSGAIGVMAVKKTASGYYFYFAHNTDSFALASMGGNEKEPKCTMSRLSAGAKIAKGGRKIRLA